MKDLNGAMVIDIRKDAVYIRIPYDQARDCDGCSCDYCKAHPELTPKWDCLAIPTKLHDHAWTVHMPVPPSKAERDKRDKR